MTTWLTSSLGFQAMHDEFPEDVSVVEVLDLKDGWNDPELVYKKAKKILARIGRGKKVVLFCHAGLSRSPGMAILALAWLSRVEYEDMHFQVVKEAPQVQMAPGFEGCCKEDLKLLNKRLVKTCGCGAPIEEEESKCEYCSSI